MKSNFLFLFIFLFAESSFAQTTGKLSGTVTDGSSKDKIAFADIYDVVNNRNIAESDVDGNFTCVLPAANYRLVCSYIGLSKDTFSVTIDAGQSVVYNPQLKTIQHVINEVVVSAGKYEQSLDEITQSISILKPKLIEDRNATNATQALDQVPGLNILDQDPQIRGGSGYTFGVGTRVAVLVDGMPLLSGDVGKPDWDFIPLESLDHVEVIKGTSSVLYGSCAMSGTINFLTSYPTKPQEFKVTLYSGYYSTPSNPATKWWNGLADYSGFNLVESMRTQRIDFVIGGQFLYDHGYIGPSIANPSLPFPPDSLSNSDVATRIAHVNFNFRYRPKNVTGLSYGLNGNFLAEHSNFSLIWQDAGNNIYRAFPQTMTLTKAKEFYLDPFISYFAPSGFHQDFKARIYYTNNNNTNAQSSRDWVYYMEYQVSKDSRKIKDLHYTAGVVANLDYSKAELFSASGSPYNQERNFAAFAQLDKKFWNTLNFSVGVRDEYFKTNDLDAVTKPIFRAGLNYQLGKGTFIRYSYGQGYRYPTIAERYITTSVGGITVFSNPDIVPETSWNTELGIMQGFKIAQFEGFLDAAYFWQQYYNSIEYNYALWEPGLAGFKFVNTGTTRVKGIDISLDGDGKLSDNIGLTILAGYTYTMPQSLDPDYVYAVEHPSEGFIPKKLSYASTSTDTTDDILKYRFRTIAKIDVELSYKNAGIGFSQHYYSNMQNIDQTFYDLDKPGLLPSGITKYRAAHDKGTWVSDAHVSYKFAKYYKAALVANNLFNLEYSLRPLKIEPMRTVALRLSADM